MNVCIRKYINSQCQNFRVANENDMDQLDVLTVCLITAPEEGSDTKYLLKKENGL